MNEKKEKMMINKLLLNYSFIYINSFLVLVSLMILVKPG